jgi:hypothetical protein
MSKTSLDTIIQEFHLIQSPHDDDNIICIQNVDI